MLQFVFLPSYAAQMFKSFKPKLRKNQLKKYLQIGKTNLFHHSNKFSALIEMMQCDQRSLELPSTTQNKEEKNPSIILNFMG